MTRTEANTQAYQLWEKWVSLRPAYGIDGYFVHTSNIDEYRYYDIDTIHASMLQEYRWTLKNLARMTPACFRELKGELILLGKIRKALKTDS